MARYSLRSAIIGLTLLVGPFSFMALAQEYIDVEAEREAREREARERAGISTSGPDNRPVTGTSGSGGTVSYGVGTGSAANTQRLPPPSPPPADNVGGMFNQVQRLQQEVMRLNGVVEQLTFELNQLKEQSLERYLDIDRRLSSGATASAGEGQGQNSGTATAAPDTAPSGRQANVPEQPGEGDAYRSAYALVRGKEFDAAVSAFTAFLDRFPDGRYAPNAHYWLGELYLVLDPPDPEAARQSFTLLLDQYPDNDKIPDAMFKLGRVYFMKGNSDRAREFLNRTMREYPDSSAARLAGDFLDQNL